MGLESWETRVHAVHKSQRKVSLLCTLGYTPGYITPHTLGPEKQVSTSKGDMKNITEMQESKTDLPIERIT